MSRSRGYGKWMAALAVVVLLTGCTAADTGSSDSSQADAPAPGSASTSSAVDGSAESSDSNLTTRRTTVEDVTFVDLSKHPLPNGYTQSAVSVDAWRATDVLTDDSAATVERVTADLEEALGGGDLVVSAQILSCELIAVWVLPEPDSLRIGHETHPSSRECTKQTTYDVLFAIPKSGTNSEGSWDYSNSVPEVRLEVRVGAQD